MILPPLALSFLQRRRVVPSAGLWAKVADLTLIGSSLFVFLPPAIATFPQTASIKAERLEKEFQNVTDERGEAVKVFEFNKGL